MDFRYNMPTKLYFGRGCLSRLHKDRFPGRKALIVTTSDEYFKDTGILEKVQAELELAGIEYAVYDGIGSNPSRDQVMDGVAAYNKNGCEFVIAVGGGSILDASKALSIVATNGGDLWDYFVGGTAKGKPARIPMAPLITIPTTAGTGSEVDQWMVISDRETGEKIGYGFSRSFARTAYVDSDLMMTVPPRFTAYQGIDAMLHSIEAILSNDANLLTDSLAMRSIGLVSEYLPRAVENGQDAEAREHVALAATISGIILANVSMTSEHGMEDGLSGFFPRLPHGAGLIAISMEYFKLIISKGYAEDRFVGMAKAMGKADAVSSDDFITCIEELYKKCGVDDVRMSEFGVTNDRFPDIVASAKKNAPMEFAAEREPLTDEECVGILMRSYK